MKQIIISIIGNLICYFIGFWLGYKDKFRKPRAYIKLNKNGNVEACAPTLRDSMAMFAGLMLHMERNGYNVEGIEDAFAEVVAAGIPLHELKKEDDHAE